MLIYNEEYEFGIMWDVSIVSEDWIYGNINFIISDEILPKKFALNFTLGTVFFNLKNSFENKYYDVEGSDNVELGDREIDYHKLNHEEEANIFEITTTELGDKFGYECNANCLQLKMGYSGNEERLFYSEDFGESYREIRMPKGTVENIIMQLPVTRDELLENRGRVIVDMPVTVGAGQL